MPFYVLHHHHEPEDCAVAFAAWHGFRSPLRRQPALSTCLDGDHSIWWRVEAPDPTAALALLPRYVARRTRPIEVHDVDIP
jgi:hypothetical protein